MSEIVHGIQIQSAKVAKNFGGARAFERERTKLFGPVFENDVIHDDELIESLDEALANHGVRNDEQAVFERERFDFGENAALRTQKQRNIPVAGTQVADVAGEHGVEIANAVSAGEGK